MAGVRKQKPHERAGAVWNQQTGADRAYDVVLSIDDEDVADNKGPIIASFPRKMEAQACALRINEAVKHALSVQGTENRRLRADLRRARRAIREAAASHPFCPWSGGLRCTCPVHDVDASCIAREALRPARGRRK